MSALDDDGYRAFRRDLHRNPEPAWREFYTTARIVEELRERDLTDLYVGPDALATDDRMNVPDDEELAEWEQRPAMRVRTRRSSTIFRADTPAASRLPSAAPAP